MDKNSESVGWKAYTLVGKGTLWWESVHFGGKAYTLVGKRTFGRGMRTFGEEMRK